MTAPAAPASRRRVAWAVAGSAVVGVALGALSSHLLFGGTVLVLIPWAVVCGVLGGLLRGWRLATVCAAVFGFAVSFVFLLGAFDGRESLVAAIGLFVGLSVLGAFTAAIVALVVNRLVFLLRRR